jgi:hypothetical protein
VRLFKRRSDASSDQRSALQHWRDLASRAIVSGADLESAIAAAQHELPSTTAYAVLAGAFLLAAEQAGLGTVPTDEACRFAGLAAAVVKRAAAAGELPAPLNERFQIIRGRLRGSVYVPRDVEDAFAGRSERLEGLATDPRGLATIRTLLKSRAGTPDPDVRRQFVEALAAALTAA